MKFFKAVILMVFVSVPAMAADSYRVEATKDSQQAINFHSLRAESTDKGVRVSGSVRSFNRANLRSGHIDVAAFSPAGDLIAEAKTDYTLSPTNPSNRKISKSSIAYFTAYLKEKLPSDSVIRVRFHRE